MSETVVATHYLHTFHVDGHELTATEWKNDGFLTVRINSNHRIYLQSFWENLVIEMQRQLSIKITGTSGPFMVEEGRNVADIILVFYQPQK